MQFAYDYFEDRWFMEGTAAWMEDEIYDAIDDNLQYFSASPLQDPTVPLDKDVGLRIYGTWIFWRFLSEYFGSASSHDASVIRAVWNKADYSPNGPDQYSAQAVATVVNARSIGGKRWHFSWAFADFAAWNAAPSRFYEEGRANGYPKAAISKTAAITGSNRRVTAASSLDHLSNRYVAVNRGRGVHADATLKVVLNGPASATSPEASVVVIKKSGAASFKGVSLNADGDGSVVVNFGDTVARVVVITTNASVRFTKCYRRLTPSLVSGRRARGRRPLLLLQSDPRTVAVEDRSSITAGNGSATGSTNGERPFSSNRSIRRSSTRSTTSVFPVSARSAAILDTAGPHIMPWPQAQAMDAPSTSRPSRSTKGRPAAGGRACTRSWPPTPSSCPDRVSPARVG